MAKEKLHEMKQTDNSFQLRGIITGTQSQRFYKSGTGKNGGAWNAVEFGVKIAENKTIYCTLRGFPKSEVYYYKAGENGAKGTTQKVAWKDRKKSPGNGYRLIGVNISVDKDEEGKNINNTFVEYDAVEYLRENLKDDTSVFIKGKLEFSSFTDKNEQVRRKVEFVPNQISFTQKPIDFDAEDYVEMAEFENTLVFQSIDKEEDENGKGTGRFILSGWSIGYNSVENVSFILDEEHTKLATNIKKAMKTGYSIKTFGRVSIFNDISTVEDDESGWGETSPMQKVNSPTKREYIVYRAEPSSIDKEAYSEDDIMTAIRKINTAKKATENFGDKANESNDADDWSTDDEDDDTPWD